MTSRQPIASLPMYDWPEVASSTDAFWRGLRRFLMENGFSDVPASLNRNDDVHDQWRDPDLLFSQTCGYPLTHEFDGELQLLATPVYGVAGCSGANYSSFIIVAAGSSFNSPADLRGGRAAYNTGDSMSGLLALRAVFAPLAGKAAFFREIVHSGGHANSLQMVASGRADVAAIDCVSLALAERHRPHLTSEIRTIAQGPGAPSLPFVTSRTRSSREIEAMRQALVSACADPALAGVRAELFLDGLVFTSRKDYDRVLEIETGADRFGYTTLR